MVILAQTTFTNSLRSTLPAYVHSLDDDTIIATGSTKARQNVLSDEFAGLLSAYSISLDHIIYLGAGTAVILLAASCFIGWTEIRYKGTKTQQEGDEVDSQAEYDPDQEVQLRRFAVIQELPLKISN